MIYRIKVWIKRTLRAFRWFWFIYKQPSWLEYDNYVKINSRYLREMAKEFRDKDITVSSQRHAQRMETAARLIENGTNEKYEREYSESMWIDDKIENWPYGLSGDRNVHGGYHESYSFQDSLIASKKDQRSIELGFKIISTYLTRWWQ